MNYHIKIGFPDTLVIPEKTVYLTYTQHALNRRQRYDNEKKLMIIPSFVVLKKENIFEVHTEDDVKCTKVLVRTSYDRYRDITLVLDLLIAPEAGKERARVITFWLNRKMDIPSDFKEGRYDIPKNKSTNDEQRND